MFNIKKTFFILAVLSMTIIAGCATTKKQPPLNLVYELTLKFKDFELKSSYIYSNLTPNKMLSPLVNLEKGKWWGDIASLKETEKIKEAEGNIKKGSNEQDVLLVLGEPDAVSNAAHYGSSSVYAWLYFYSAVVYIPKQVIIFKDGKVVQATEAIFNEKKGEFDIWRLDSTPKWKFDASFSFKSE
jgi:outer membrane protein assembly factor BamE (lipoprotein component of BamABCDE complex)